MADTTDLLGQAIDKNILDFTNTFDEIIRQKSVEALENKRVELAQSIYGSDEDDNVDFDEDDFDSLDDEDIDDIDLDFDLDLDDIDLEDLQLDDEDGINDEDA